MQQMEDDLKIGLENIMKNTQEELKRIKSLTDINYNKLNPDQKKELDNHLNSVEFKELNDTINKATNNIFNDINKMFN